MAGVITGINRVFPPSRYYRPDDTKICSQTIAISGNFQLLNGL